MNFKTIHIKWKDFGIFLFMQPFITVPYKIMQINGRGFIAGNALNYFQLLPGGKYRKFNMRISLVPETNGGNIGLLQQIPSSLTPSQVLNSYFKIFFKTDRIKYMPKEIKLKVFGQITSPYLIV